MKRSALILAGGTSSRMGVDKASLPFGDRTFLKSISDVCTQVCDEVVIAVTGGRERFKRRPGDGLRYVEDSGEGPLVAVATHLDAFDCLFVTACDTPLLQPAVIELLFRRAEGNRGAVPLVNGRPQATCAVYSGSLSAEALLLVTSGERRLSALTRLPGVAPVDEEELLAADPELRSFRGCNTPEEYVSLLEFAGQPAPQGFLDAAGVRVARQA